MKKYVYEIERPLLLRQNKVGLECCWLIQNVIHANGARKIFMTVQSRISSCPLARDPTELVKVTAPEFWEAENSFRNSRLLVSQD